MPKKATPSKNKAPLTRPETVTFFAEAWADAAAACGITWYLYDTALLCAATIGHTPDGYNEWTVAIQPMDYPRVIEEVLPLFQDRTNCLMSVNGHTIVCTHAANLENVVIRIGLLRPASPEEAKTDDRLRVSTQKGRDGNDHPIPYPEPADTVTLNGVTYPTFANYPIYLQERFLDYENCFDDPIGCNLTRETKAELIAHQQDCIEALRFLEELSQKYGLKYRLLSGSVLGAVRHGGFIPWDDDIDIGICVEDLAAFEEKLREHLPEKFRLFYRQADVDYPRMFTKICCDGRCCIDLFPLLPVPQDALRAKAFWFFGKFWRKLHHVKIGDDHRTDFRMKGLARLIALFFSDKQIMQLADRHDRRYVNTDAPCYVNMYSIYSRRVETVPAHWVLNPQRMSFAGIDVPVMGCPDDYLTHMYGDYRIPPFPWDRAHRHVARFNITDTEDCV